MPNRSQRYTQALHRGRLEQLAEIKLRPSYNGMGEAEVVPGFQLSHWLRKWTVWYLDGRHPMHSDTGGLSEGQQDEAEIRFYGPVQYLAEKTGIHIRRVSGIVNGQFPCVPLSQADKLLQVIERPDLLGDEIQVVPNPNWSLERWVDYMRERGCV